MNERFFMKDKIFKGDSEIGADTLIDSLLARKCGELGESFVSNTLSRISVDSARCAERDSVIDRLLARMVNFELPHFADAVLERTRRAGKFAARKIFAFAGAAAVAACAALAVFSASRPTSARISGAAENYYVRASDISAEITAIRTLVAQEEVIDILKL